MFVTQISNNIRRLSLLAIHAAGSGHPGGALSCADLVAYITNRLLNNFHFDAADTQRNRFILSKGHACPALYAAAALHDLIKSNELLHLRKISGKLQGHTSNVATPWVETSTGSLGQGFSVGLGLAMGYRYLQSGGRIIVMLGDGELQEGQVWETAMCAAHYQLSNLTAVIDYNKLQSDDLNANIIGLEPLRDKWQAFGWRVLEINGHDFAEIEAAFAPPDPQQTTPTVIIAHTIKGKGVDFMENSPLWHGSVKLTNEQLRQSLLQLGVDEYDVDVYLKDKSIAKGLLLN